MPRIYSNLKLQISLVDLFTVGILYRFAEFSINCIYPRAGDVVFIRDNRTTKDSGEGRGSSS